MRRFNILTLTAVVLFGLMGIARATTINFSQAEVPTINDLDPVTTQWNPFGIGVANAYWYLDPRDPFDQQGLSVSPIGSSNPGRITFLNGPVSNLSVQWWTITGDETLDIFDSANNNLGEVSGLVGSGVQTFSASDIAYLEWHDSGGLVQVSGVDFTPQGIPEPSTLLLLGPGFIALAGFIGRRRHV